MLRYIYIGDLFWVVATAIGVAMTLRVYQEALFDVAYVRANRINGAIQRDAYEYLNFERIRVIKQLIGLCAGLGRLLSPPTDETGIYRGALAASTVIAWSLLLTYSSYRNIKLRRAQRDEYIARHQGRTRTRESDTRS